MAEHRHTIDRQNDKFQSECKMFMFQKSIMCDVIKSIGKDKHIVEAHNYIRARKSSRSMLNTMFGDDRHEKGRD